MIKRHSTMPLVSEFRALDQNVDDSADLAPGSTPAAAKEEQPPEPPASPTRKLRPVAEEVEEAAAPPPADVHVWPWRAVPGRTSVFLPGDHAAGDLAKRFPAQDVGRCTALVGQAVAGVVDTTAHGNAWVDVPGDAGTGPHVRRPFSVRVSKRVVEENELQCGDTVILKIDGVLGGNYLNLFSRTILHVECPVLSPERRTRYQRKWANYVPKKLPKKGAAQNSRWSALRVKLSDRPSRLDV